MASPHLTLFVDAFFCNPYDFRVWVALREKGLDFTASRVMTSEGQGLAPAYREKSITARVPGLAHGEFLLAESLAIVDYLEDAFPPPAWPRLFPEDLRARARARQVMAFLTADLPALILERPSRTVFYPTELPPLSPAARADADLLLSIGSRLLASGELATWSIAWADLTFALLRLTRSGEALPPELQALVDESVSRPSVRSYLEHERPPNPPLTGRRTAV